MPQAMFRDLYIVMLYSLYECDTGYIYIEAELEFNQESHILSGNSTGQKKFAASLPY